MPCWRFYLKTIIKVASSGERKAEKVQKNVMTPYRIITFIRRSGGCKASRGKGSRIAGSLFKRCVEEMVNNLLAEGAEALFMQDVYCTLRERQVKGLLLHGHEHGFQLGVA